MRRLWLFCLLVGLAVGDDCLNGSPTENGIQCGSNSYCEISNPVCCEAEYPGWCCEQGQTCGPSQEKGCMTIDQVTGTNTQMGEQCGSGEVCTGEDGCCSESWCCDPGGRCGNDRFNCSGSIGSLPQMGMPCGTGVCLGASPDLSICCGSWCCTSPANACGNGAPWCQIVSYQFGQSASPSGGTCGYERICLSSSHCCSTEDQNFCCPTDYDCNQYTAGYCVPPGNQACQSSFGDGHCCESDATCCGNDCCDYGESCCSDLSCARICP
jgi:hypothetical protein